MAKPTPLSVQDVLKLVRDEAIAFIDLRYLDYPGYWQSVSMPADQLKAEDFEAGIGFDGSVIQQWGDINEGDMLLVPVAETAHRDPFTVRPTLGLVCNIKDPVTKKRYSRDPRSVARKAEAYLAETGIADAAHFSPEVEFFVFDSARFDQKINSAWYELKSPEGTWSRGDDSPINDGYHISTRTGQFPAPPLDHLHDVRAEMASVAMELGLPVEQHHHEVATGGQCEIDLRHRPLVRAADDLVLLKHVVRNVAARHGMTATFMPKPLFGDNGSGLHTHFSMFKDGENLFAGKRYANLSRAGLHAIGGLLKHAPALAALTSPTTNSFKRLTPGYEAPVHWSTPRGTVPRRSVCRSTRTTRRPSGWSSGSPTPPATRTWPMPRWSWRRSTASRTRSTPASRSIGRCRTWTRMPTATSRACRSAWTGRWMCSKRTTGSSPRATCSPSR